jgi:hypothetical protein
MRKYVALYLLAIALLIGAIVGTACIPTIADAIVGNEDPIRVDTLFIPGPTDTLYCHVKHGHTECWR